MLPVTTNNPLIRLSKFYRNISAIQNQNLEQERQKELQMGQFFVLYRYEKDDKILISSLSFLTLFLGTLV